MAIYLGDSEKLKLCLDGTLYIVCLPIGNTETNGIELLSSDGYILGDSKGVYLMAKESG